MYCSSCGAAVGRGLSYCNFCGAKLGEAKAELVVRSPEVKAESIVFSMVSVFVFGLVGITVLIGVMKAVLGLNAGLIVAFALLSFLIMLLIEGVFVSLLLRRRRGTDEAGDGVLPSKGRTTRELEAAQARALPEAMPSVTEETTRALETLYRERGAK